MRDTIRRYAVPVYFVSTFLVSWGGVLLAVGPGGIPGTPSSIERALPTFVVTLLAGPSLCGLALTAVVHGRAGLRDLRARLVRARLDPGWYAIALLGAPSLMLALLLALTPLSSRFVPAILASPDPGGVLASGFAIALGAGFFEELGWTGFAIPEVRRRHGVVATGLIVGLAWAAWHLLPAYWMSGITNAPLARPSFLLDPFLYLLGFRVLMVWVYDRTQSLLLAMLMHLSLTASARILSPPGIAGWPLITFDSLWAACVWAMVAWVARERPGRT